MKKYGLVLADNGSPWYFQGEQHRKWPEELIEDLKQIPASEFVAVDTSSLKVVDELGSGGLKKRSAGAGTAGTQTGRST